MKTTPKMLKTDSFRCSDLLAALLLVVLAVLPLKVQGQRVIWNLPQYQETVRTGTVALGSSFARDTYLSASRYDGPSLGFVTDSWIGYRPYRLFKYGRNHSSFLVSPMTNRLDGGSTIQVACSDYFAWLHPLVSCSQCDLLAGPVAMVEMGMLFNLQNTNNPFNLEGYVAAGFCLDNTFRFSLFSHEFGLQATTYLPLAGVGFAPDYDQPYWYMLKYAEFDKALHFIWPYNNQAIAQQVALILPMRSNRLSIGYCFDYMGNRLGGHSRSIANGVFTIGYSVRFQSKVWGI